MRCSMKKNTMCKCKSPAYNPIPMEGFKGMVRCCACNNLVQMPDERNMTRPSQELFNKKLAQWAEEDKKLRKRCECGSKFEAGEVIDNRTYCKRCEGYKPLPETPKPKPKPKPTIEERIILLENRVEILEKTLNEK